MKFHPFPIMDFNIQHSKLKSTFYMKNKFEKQMFAAQYNLDIICLSRTYRNVSEKSCKKRRQRLEMHPISAFYL